MGGGRLGLVSAGGTAGTRAGAARRTGIQDNATWNKATENKISISKKEINNQLKCLGGSNTHMLDAHKVLSNAHM